MSRYMEGDAFFPVSMLEDELLFFPDRLRES